MTILNAKRRLLFGQYDSNPPSRFINEISDEYINKELELPKKDSFSKTFYNKSDKYKNVDTNLEYIIGEKVVHDEFGEGVIITIDKSILTIAFPHPFGIRKIMKGHKSIKKQN